MDIKIRETPEYAREGLSFMGEIYNPIIYDCIC